MSSRKTDSRSSSSSGRSVRHSRGGCLTCKDRRVKCDEGKPECQRCLNSKYACKGYESTPGVVLVLPENPSASASPLSRHAVPPTWLNTGIPRTPGVGGNDDPFGSIPISIGGRENENFRFHRDVYMATIWGPGGLLADGSQAASRRHWNHLRDSLCSKETALACLARNASIAYFFTDQSMDATNLLTYKTKARRAIVEKLNESPLKGVEFQNVIWAIAMLACADLLTDPPLVKVHLDGLKPLLTDARYKEQAKLIDACQVACIVAIDVNQAVLLYRPCILDHGIWFAQLCQSITKMTAARFPDLDYPETDDLDEALQDDYSVSNLFQMQNMDSTIYKVVGNRSGEQENLLLMDWLSCRQAMIRGTLLKLALASVKESEQCEDRGERVEVDTRTFLCLAGLHYFHLNSPGALGSRKMADYSTFKHYQVLLHTMIKEDVQRLAKQKNDNRYFWALYVGAQSHIVDSQSVVEQDRLENDWFAQQFVKHIHRRGLATWTQVKAILQGFWYSAMFEAQEAAFVTRMIARRRR